MLDAHAIQCSGARTAPLRLACVPQVITCAASDAQDVVLKKSLYLYITTWATANPELMLLTINMLLKDCGDQDPTIRGLALRSLCSLRISNLTEYLVSRDRGQYLIAVQA